MESMSRRGVFSVLFSAALALCAGLQAQEVPKGGIPADQLAPTYLKLPWGCEIWDAEHALEAMKAKDPSIAWLDCRPLSMFKSGSFIGAVHYVYDITGAKYEDGEIPLTKEKLQSMLDKPGVKRVAVFCQGPKCHRSYNVTYMAVKEWGIPAEKMIWFRDGFPDTLKKIMETPALKRKAKDFLDEAGLKIMQ